MKLFKTIDDRLNDIGFVKVIENEHGARYERKNEEYKYIQCLDINHNANDCSYYIQSYEKHINSDGFNNAVRLSRTEMELIFKKVDKMRRKLFLNQPLLLKICSV